MILISSNSFSQPLPIRPERRPVQPMFQLRAHKAIQDFNFLFSEIYFTKTNCKKLNFLKNGKLFNIKKVSVYSIKSLKIFLGKLGQYRLKWRFFSVSFYPNWSIFGHSLKINISPLSEQNREGVSKLLFTKYFWKNSYKHL